jgi:hypothetical protein
MHLLGAGDRARTGDSLLGKQVLYQLSYARKVAENIADSRTAIKSACYAGGNPTSSRRELVNAVPLPLRVKVEPVLSATTWR